MIADSRNMRITEFVTLYDQQTTIAPTTKYQYFQTAQALERWAEHPVLVRELSDDLLNGWLRAMAESDLSPSTANSRRKHLLALWRSAHRNGLVDKLPNFIRRVKVPFRMPEAWTVDEVRLIIDSANWVGGWFSSTGIRRQLYWRTAICLEWDTALRTTDLLTLTPTDLASDVGRLVQKKTGYEIAFRLNDCTRELVGEIARDPELPVLETRQSGESFRKTFRRIVERAPVPFGSFKKLRKSSASNVELHHPGCGAAHLGHARSTATDHYLDPRITGRRKPLPEPLVVEEEVSP